MSNLIIANQLLQTRLMLIQHRYMSEIHLSMHLYHYYSLISLFIMPSDNKYP